MTVIAYKDGILAADKQGNLGSRRVRVTKIVMLQNGDIVAWTGRHDTGIALAEWYNQGAVADKFPEFQ